MDANERLQNELSLLEAMYPEQTTWNNHSRELKYFTDDRAFLLRIPEGYLVDELPEVLSATVERADARQQLQQQIQNCHAGDELLDSIILAFNELAIPAVGSEHGKEGTSDGVSKVNAENPSKATVIIWLHHLLNTNKRKQALSPPSPAVCGVTKPGYPGVLIYSGPADAVYEHVNELKQLNWQAFQVRYESDESWTFAHGEGVKEVEAMKDVVAEVGVRNKDELLEAMRMK